MSMEGAVRARPNGFARVGGRLAGKVAVITGGASGIGQACAVRFTRNARMVTIGIDRMYFHKVPPYNPTA